MSRLIVFGCSIAYGVGLSDCWPNLSKPSKLSWTNIIAQNLGRKLVNKSRPGSSNKSIWFAIHKFKFEPDDIVIISWSYPYRYSIIKSPLTNFTSSIKNLQVHKMDHDESSRSYYTDVYSKYDSTVMSKLYIDHANRILIEKGLIVYNLVIERQHSLLIGNHNFIPLYMGEYESVYPRALDGDHLGLEGQQVFASDLMKYLDGNHSQINSYKLFFKSFKNRLCK